MQASYPLKVYKKISSKFGWRWFFINGGKKYSDFHYGWDFSAAEGTPVYANADGICYIGYDLKGFGNYILIVGKTQQDNVYHIYYGHLKQDSLRINNGQRVKSGTIIAEVGNTGFSTAPHLHWEIRFLKNKQFRAVNPKQILNENLVLPS